MKLYFSTQRRKQMIFLYFVIVAYFLLLILALANKSIGIGIFILNIIVLIGLSLVLYSSTATRYLNWYDKKIVYALPEETKTLKSYIRYDKNEIFFSNVESLDIKPFLLTFTLKSGDVKKISLASLKDTDIKKIVELAIKLQKRLNK